MKNWLKLCLVFVLVFTMSTGSALSALAAQMALPAALKTVEAEAFAGDRSIDEIVLPDGILTIGARAFADSTLTSITLPDTITAIADDAFEGSPDVTALVTAGSYAMRWCRRNHIPYQLTETPDEVIYGLDVVEDLSIRHGYSFSVCIWRSHEYAGQDAVISFVDAGGNTVASETFADGKTERWLSFASDALSPGTFTLTMAVDGAVIPGEQITLEVRESALYFDKLYNRESKGTVRSLKVTYDAEGYNCPVTFSIDNEAVASLSGNLLTYHSCGYVTVTATCAHGQTISRRVVVYDPSSTLKPEFYIEPYSAEWYDEDDVYQPEWMDYVDLLIGTDDDLTQINQERFDIDCDVEFLDADGNVLCDDDYAQLYHTLLEQKDDTGWNDADVWLEGARADAAFIRITILEGKLYTVDPDRCTVTYPLPSLDTYPEPVVTYTYPESIEKGEAVEVTFECLNPASLGEGRPVGLLNPEDETIIYASGTLTPDQPIVTLTHALTDEEWDEAAGGENSETGYFTLVYEISYPVGSSTARDTIYITPGAVFAFGYDLKLSIGSTRSLYCDYTGTEPDLTFTSTNPAAVSIDQDCGYYAVVKGLAQGWSTIVATTPSGKSFSCRVTVYDPDNTVVPAVGFSDTQTAETARWNSSLSLNVETTTVPETFGIVTLNLQVDYLNESGSVVASGTATARPYRSFARSEDTIFYTPSTAEMGMAYAEGARSIRLSIVSGSCTLISGQDSVTLPIEDPNTASKPIVFMQAPKYAVRGEEVDVSVTCVNPSVYGSDRYVYTLYSDNINEPLAIMILSADEPTVSARTTIPNISMYSFSPYEVKQYRLNLSGDWGGYVGNVTINVLDGSVGSIGKMPVGGTAALSYSLTEVDDLTVSFESSDPSVATVDASGNVTAVAPGLFGITMTYGPVVETAYGRVYSASPEGKPEVTLYNYDPEAEFKPSSTFYLVAAITDGIESLGDYHSILYRMDYLNDDGEVVFSSEGSDYLGFDTGADARFYVMESYELYTAVLNGATSVRFSLRESETYTISDTYAPFTAPIADTDEWYGTHIGYTYNPLTTRGAEETITFSMLAASASYTGVDATITFRVYDGKQYFIDGETRVISTDNPTCQLTFTVPETATNLQCHYTIQFGEDQFSSNIITPDLLYFTNEQSDATLTVGSTLTAAYVYSLDDMDVSYETSDPNVATVTDSGVVTGISTGIAAITIHVGPAVRSFDVRVYDENGTFAEPELYLYNPDPSQTVYSNTSFRVGVGSNTDVRQLAGKNSFAMRYDFLDADGKVVYSGSSSGSTFSAAFAADSETTVSASVSSSVFFSAAAADATHMRYTLLGGSGYTVDESRSSVLIPLRDPSEWGITKLSFNKISYLYTNDAFNGQVKLLSLSEKDADETYTVTLSAYDNNQKYYHTDAVQTLSAENHEANFAIPAVDDSVSYIRFVCTVTRDSDGASVLSDSWYTYYVRLTGVQSDMLLKVGESQYAYYSGDNIGNISTSHTSSNPAVAAISSSSRYVNAVAPGTAQITITFGELTHTFNVRVYDDSLTYAEPEIHFSDSSDACMDEMGNTTLCFGTDSSVSELGGPVSVSYSYQYLDADGNEVYAFESGSSISVGFASGACEVNANMSDSMRNAVASGATHLRLTLKEGDGYTIDPDRSTVLVPIPDVSGWTSVAFGFDYDTLYYGGDTVTVNMKLLSCPEKYADRSFLCTLSVSGSSYYGSAVLEEQKIINADNPVASYTFKVPDTYRLSLSYNIVFEDTSGGVTFDTVNPMVVYASSKPADTLVSLGGTKQVSYSVSNSEYVPVSYESSNPEVVTIDDSCLLTGVSVGTATITARFGDLVHTFGVRVYDPSAAYAVPELSLSADPTVTGLTPGKDSLYVMVSSSEDPVNLDDSISASFRIEYLTNDGSVLRSTSLSSSLRFITDPTLRTAPASVSAFANYAAQGMTGVRVTLLAGSTAYTVDEDANSVLIPVADPSGWGKTTFGLGAPAGLIPGKEYTVPVRMLCCAEADQAREYTVKLYRQSGNSSYSEIYYESEPVAISAGSPTAEFALTLPDNGSSSNSYVKYAVFDADGDQIHSDGMYVYPYYFTSTPADTLLTVGGTYSPNVKAANSSSLSYAWIYESSNPAAATVEASGKVTAVAPGISVITVRFGDLETSYGVRVYDSSAEHATPELSLSPNSKTTGLRPGDNLYATVSTDTDPAELGGYFSASFRIEYVTEDGASLYSSSTSAGIRFAASNEEEVSFTSFSGLENYVAAGATHVRLSLTTSSSYTIAEGAESILIPIADPDEWGWTAFGSCLPSSMARGEEYTVPVRMLCAAEEDLEKEYTAKLTLQSSTYTSATIYYESEPASISAADPDAEFTFTVPTGLSSTFYAICVITDADGNTVHRNPQTVRCYYFNSTPTDKVINVGSTASVSASIYNSGYIPYTLTYESSNPDVATVSATGTVTGVSVGTAEITLRCGELEQTVGVRVYDSSAAHATPELSLSAAPGHTGMTPSYAGAVLVSTDEDVTNLGSSFSAKLRTEYVTDDGSALYSVDTSYTILFVREGKMQISLTAISSLPNYVVNGMTGVRLSLLTSSSYTIAEGAGSVLIPVADPSEWNATTFGSVLPAGMVPGKECTVPLRMLSCTEADQEGEFAAKLVLQTSSSYSATVLYETEATGISAANPIADFTFTVPETLRSYSSIYAKCTVTNAAGTSVHSNPLTVRPYYVSSTPTGTVISVGSTASVSVSIANTSYLSYTRTYESSDPEIVTVDAAGVLTGVSVGVADITVRYGDLEAIVPVRVYDASVAQSTPVLRLSPDPELSGLTPDQTVSLLLCTDSDPVTLGSSCSAKLKVEYVTADGGVLYTTSTSKGISFIRDPSLKITLSNIPELANYVTAGMTHVRVSLNTSSAYTIAEGAGSLLIPVADPAGWGKTTFGSTAPAGMVPGKEYTLPLRMLCCAEADQGADFTAKLYLQSGTSASSTAHYESEAVTINAANPDACFTFTVPDSLTSGFYARFCVTNAAGSSVHNNTPYVRSYYFSTTPVDKVVAAGSTVSASVNVNNSSYLPYAFTYESSDPAIATVNESGVITGVSAGTAVITVRYGDLESSLRVRVYDAYTTAALSLSAPETATEWSWNLKGDLVITADQPVESLGPLSYVRIYSYYYSADGSQVGSSYYNCYFNFIDSNEVTVSITNSLTTTAMMKAGAVSVQHTLYSISGTGFSINTSARNVKLPMEPMANYPDALLELGSLSSTAWVSGTDYTLSVTAANSGCTKPVTLRATASLTSGSAERTVLDTLTFTPATDGAVQTLSITAPDHGMSRFYVYFELVNDDGTTTDLSSAYVTLTIFKTAATIAELQSEHNYTDNTDMTLKYTVEGAVSLSVTLHESTATESNYDKLYFYTGDQYEAGTVPSPLSGAIGAKTIEIADDTVVIKFTSDSSNVRWGFAVTQIVATMADGSTVTITE